MDALITFEQAAELLDLSVARVRQLRDEGQLTALRNDMRQVRFWQDDVLLLRRKRDRARSNWHSERVPA